jgi:hypothetical protein
LGEYRSLSSSLCSFFHSLKSQVTQHIKATLFIHQLYFLRRFHTKQPLWHTTVPVFCPARSLSGRERLYSLNTTSPVCC